MQELNYYDKQRIHNLKYFTWIEQQGRALEELNAQWYDHENYWGQAFDSADKMDSLINEFNAMTEALVSCETDRLTELVNAAVAEKTPAADILNNGPGFHGERRWACFTRHGQPPDARGPHQPWHYRESG